MSTFTVISIVVTCLFVMTVMIIDHVEVARENRLANNPTLQQWLAKANPEHSFEVYLQDMGIDSMTCPIEELVAAHKQHQMILKILKTV